jgi:hypothetical protein
VLKSGDRHLFRLRGRLNYGNFTWRNLIAALVFANAVLLHGQSLAVYSELQRVDPFGQIVAADRGVRPREILSPAAPRNGFVSFHVAVTAPPGANYFLYVVTWPQNACRVALYKEHFAKTEAGWIPDALEPITHLPHFGAMPDPAANIPNQTTRVYLLDVWLPPDAKPPAFRLEVQLKMGDWTIWPMEVRVLPVSVPAAHGDTTRPLPAIGQSADTAARAPVEDYLRGVQESREIDAETVRAVIRRNAVQDMALAGQIDREALKNLWQAPHPAGAEWYFRVRDWIYRQLTR